MREVSKAELARWAGVSRQAVTKACKPGAPLYDASGGKGVDVEHPLVREWLESHGVRDLPEPRPDVPKPVKSRAKAARAKSPTSPTASPPAETGTVPHELKDLEDLTVREVVMRYGSVDGFKRFVDALKNIAEYKHRELRVKQQRGELIEREKVAGLVFPMIDVAFSRLVSDVPDSVSKLVVARTESGGPDTTTDVRNLIRDANSRVLKNLKQTAARLEVLKDAN
mgnify:CR=1 FL=1